MDNYQKLEKYKGLGFVEEEAAELVNLEHLSNAGIELSKKEKKRFQKLAKKKESLLVSRPQ